MKDVIVGIYPGITTAYAILDFDGSSSNLTPRSTSAKIPS